MQPATELERAVLSWKANPPGCIEELFGVRLDPWQIEALNALNDRGRVTIRACHGPGKSALAAWAVHWFMLTHFPTRIPCTAPTGHQLEDILWAELAKWHRALPEPIRKHFVHTSDRYSWTEAPKESFAVARTSRPEQPEGLQGFHCENLLFVLDEASGIPDEVYEVAQGALSEEGAKVLMTGNPTRTSGYFFDSHHRMRAHWHPMRVSHGDSPRVSQLYVDEMAEKYGADSNVYRVRVLGEFPLSDDSAVIPLELAEGAVGRQVKSYGDIAWGVDVARFGDDRTALAKLTANELLEPVKSWRNRDTMQTANILRHEWEMTPKEQQPTGIYTDVIGLGAGVIDRGLEMGLPMVPVNVAEAPSSKEQYMRLRDELWFEARAWFDTRAVTIPRDEELIAELTLPGYKMTPSGKLQVETKDELKKRGVSSPDLADAFIHALAHNFSTARREYARTYKRERTRRNSGGTEWIV